MPTRRSTPMASTTARPSVVVPLQKVLYNSEDPTLELDGLIELVIKDERQLQPGVSWTTGSFATEKTLTVLCGNHIIKAEGAFSSLTLQYPSSASFTNFLKRRETPTMIETGPSTTTGRDRDDGTKNILQVFFPSHDDYTETASELEKLKILKPVIPLTRPHSVSQIPIGILRPLSAQLPRPSSAQLIRPASAQPQLGRSRQSSGFHPGRFLSTVSYRPLQRNGRGQLIRRAADMPPPAMRISPMLHPKDRVNSSYTITERMSSSQEVHSGMFQTQYSETPSPYFPIDQNSQALTSQDSFESPYSIYGDGQEHIDIAHRQMPTISSKPGQPQIQVPYAVDGMHLHNSCLVRGVITPTTPPVFRTEAESHRPDRVTLTPDHLTRQHLQGGETDFHRLLRSTRPGFPITGHHQPGDISKQDYTNIVIKGMEHFQAIQRKLDAALTANEPNSGNMNEILAEYADDFGRIWCGLCRESGS
ncbi:hypothetical protein PpBr36_07086 [Pyricularia pennisetigena]|uniref:hypothetical protein n=1 Tax=Pyricularia pennisetigena TaxID=1578925 RepID=UPI00114FAE5C|nr:hypothetical protein PpBr36_07086 [Pyricularia pennisetigena]TLS25871.1 hypothetical protein PpBr36_07086 [Pyricularia pennisetigena]